MADTTIEWATKVWNFIRGCLRVSSGCGDSSGGGCYAETQAHRFSGSGRAYEGLTRLTLKGPRWTGKIRLVPEKLSEPLHWPRHERVFVNSMSDIFHEDVPASFLEQAGHVMQEASWHTFLALTKRQDRMLELLSGQLAWMAALPNVWWGVSVENRQDGLPRIEALRRTPATHRWLSIEPLLEDLDTVDLDGIDFVVVGGESGARARRMDLTWLRAIRDQCFVAKVPIFIKQLGERWAREGGFVGKGLTHGGEPSLWPADLRVRQFPRSEPSPTRTLDAWPAVENGNHLQAALPLLRVTRRS